MNGVDNGPGAVSIDGSQDHEENREELKEVRRARHDRDATARVDQNTTLDSSLSRTPKVNRRHLFDRSVGRFTRDGESREGGSQHVSANWRNNLFNKLQHE